MFYVLNISGGRSWVLVPEGHETLAEANQAVAWQAEGGESPNDYRVCRLTETGGRFVDIDRCTWAPYRGPYTAEAWEAHCRRIGYFPGEFDGRKAWEVQDALNAAESFISGFEGDETQGDLSSLGKVRAALRSLGDAS